MKCSPFDLRDYFLKELTVPQAAQVEEHVQDCSECRAELDQLRLTEAALFSLRDEEIPQRIAFVSDKIFEPSPLRRWMTAFWGSAGRLGFASAAMLSAAIVFSSVNRPAPAKPAPGQVAVHTTAAPPAQLTEAQIQERVDAAVDAAVARSKETTQLVSDLRRQNEETRAMLYRAADQIERYQMYEKKKQLANMKMPDSPLDGAKQ